ncbi:replication protein RepA [Cupriavidus necator]|uniref:replication protein RepA n=1 Tax=Cupriavidus necator TaxID=106590 RepID=UPI003ECF527C
MSELELVASNPSPRKKVEAGAKIVQASTVIATRKPGIDEVGFGAKCLVSASLPYRNPKPEQLINGAWLRHNGNYALWVQGGINGIPYGTYPRLFVMWLTSEALRTGSRKIHTGGSFAEFCRKLNIDRSRGKRGAGKMLIEQADRLLQSRAAFVTLPAHLATAKRADLLTAKLKHTDFLNFADEYSLFFDADERASQQGSLFESEITLTENFFNEITSHCIPVDLRAVMALQRSPMDLDIYQWLAYRMFRLTRPAYPTWEQLYQQFGSTYGRLRDFRSDFVESLKRVALVYPGLRVSEADGGTGLVLLPSPTPIAPTALPSARTDDEPPQLMLA